MKWRCVLFQRRLPEYLDGDLPAFWKRQIGAHLEHCPDCRRELAHLEEVVQAVKAHPVREPEPAFWEKFGRELHLKLAQTAQATPAPEPVRRRFLRYYLMGAPALAVLLLWATTHYWPTHRPEAVQQAKTPAASVEHAKTPTPAVPKAESPAPAIQQAQSPPPAEEMVYVGLKEGQAFEQEDEDFTDWSLEPVLAEMSEAEGEAVLKKIRQREKDGSCAVSLYYSSLA